MSSRDVTLDMAVQAEVRAVRRVERLRAERDRAIDVLEMAERATTDALHSSLPDLPAPWRWASDIFHPRDIGGPVADVDGVSTLILVVDGAIRCRVTPRGSDGLPVPADVEAAALEWRARVGPLLALMSDARHGGVRWAARVRGEVSDG